MLKKIIIIAFLWLWSSGVMAITVTLEPDLFLPGTDLSSVSPHVSLSTTGGTPVYSAPIIGEGQELPPGITDMGPFKKQVFSIYPNRNSEWFAWPDEAGVSTDVYDPDEWAKEPHGLRISFSTSVTYVNLLGLELFEDAGWGGDDPLQWWIYDSNQSLVFSDYMNTIPGTGSIGYNSDLEFDYYFWEMQFSHSDIATVIVGGESEPTTLDRLIFNVTPVPEPGTITLLSIGIIVLALRYLRSQQRKQCAL